MWLPPVEEIVAAFLRLEVPRVPFRFVQFSRNEQRAMPTLVSYWEATGIEVPEPLALETRYERERQLAYGAVLDRITTVDPAAVPMKGPMICRLYPAGLVRETADLDVLCSSVDTLWAVADDLMGLGWTLNSVSVNGIDGQAHPSVQLARPAAHPRLTNKDRVELTTVCYRGDGYRTPPRLRTLSGPPTIEDCFTWFVDEIADRDFRMRDMVDLAVFDHHFGTGEVDLVLIGHHLVDYGLRTAFARLAAEAAKRYPAATPMLTRVRAAMPRRATTKRLRAPRTSGLLAGSVAIANYTIRETNRPAVLARCERWLAGLQERFGARKLFERGVPLHGVEVSDERSAGTGIEFRGAGALLRSPVGTYALAAGPVVRSTWVEPFELVVQ
ncbi:hypothetical protein GCM10022243_58160 [Saccharothrix violaceirubra]|uniref:Uncharacterized protein n=1 Tax=Saccharothrix violaceirubra TaxID=413306 RepID=A0A7W7T382_9PSEU|nr:hypothetical protein [Saccharothrix violaceirubra]MBB4965753.1 hypothetical protein [Saccharothrix violaceirubra]